VPGGLDQGDVGVGEGAEELAAPNPRPPGKRSVRLDDDVVAIDRKAALTAL
jgi:hypothetical protein